MCKSGRVRAVRGVLKSSRTGWLIPRTELEWLREHYEKPGNRRKNIKQRMIDGVMHYRCTRCDEYKPKGGFRKEKTTELGISSRCRECINVRVRENRRKNREHHSEADKQGYRRRKERAEKEGGEAHRRYANDAIVPAADLWAMIDEHAPGSSYQEIARWSNMHPDVVRRTKRGKTTVATADKILTGLNINHLLDELVEPPGIENWSAKGDRRCRGCGRCDRVHMGRGYCYLCKSLADRGFDPAFHTGWTRSPEVQRCRSCSTTEREHFLRGLCGPCFYRADRDGLLDQYPTLYRSASTDGRDGDDGDDEADAQ
jgi:hypothetical protein